MNDFPTVESIWIAPAGGAPMESPSKVEVDVDRGVQGDRYWHGTGAFSEWPGSGRAVTLIAAEDMEAIIAEGGIDLREGRHRRNFVTRGIEVNSLLRRTFRIGSVTLRAVRTAEPCAHLEKLLGADLMRIMAGRGGIRADVLTGGTIQQGDQIVPLGEAGYLP